MKRILILTAFIIALTGTKLMAGSQGSSKETRDLKGFTSVSFGIAGDLYITIGSEYKVVLEGKKDLLDDILTEVSSDRLVIKKDRSNWSGFNERITIYITMPEIKGLGVSGSGKAEIRDAVKTETLNLSVSGSGNIYVSEITAENLDCHISGSGNINITGKGQVAKGEISVSGSGNYKGDELQIGTLGASISGSGNCTCNVTQSLRASVSGSGNVNYAGDPKVDARVSGSGKVRSR